MERWSSLTLGKLTALFTSVGVLVAVVAGGQGIFSPGELSVKQRAANGHGGVRSHAEIKNCSACHTAPWSSATMAQRCLDCHADIRKQIDGRQPLHGTLARGQDCRACHTEHRGAHGVLTDFSTFDHDCTAFKLTGKHRSVACASCHKGPSYRGTPQACVSCHTEPVSHRGRFGTNCVQCHTTTVWTGSDFIHDFPMNHANAMRKGQGCAICHEQPGNFKSYTCSNCHRHDPVKTAERHAKRNLVNIAHCAGCHPRARKPTRMQAEVDADELLPDRDLHRRATDMGARHALAELVQRSLADKGSFSGCVFPFGSE
jgi:hypothetical protein